MFSLHKMFRMLGEVHDDDTLCFSTQPKHRHVPPHDVLDGIDRVADPNEDAEDRQRHNCDRQAPQTTFSLACGQALAALAALASTRAAVSYADIAVVAAEEATVVAAHDHGGSLACKDRHVHGANDAENGQEKDYPHDEVGSKAKHCFVGLGPRSWEDVQ
mmetsp:Transcript_27832/g.51950  ORF Transcript_27832/g.51950 Transcript_27832/m.51950 type:complete len:160 (+) Transcript_27832:134-613(+)